MNLKWREVDLETSVIIRKVRKNRERLEIPLNDVAQRVVHAWDGMKKSQVSTTLRLETDFKDLRVGLKKPSPRPGLKTSTGTRSTFATRVNKGGADIVTLKQLLGHSDVKMTMRYAQTSRGAKAQAVRLLAAGGEK